MSLPLLAALALTLAAGPGPQGLVSSKDSLAVLNGLSVIVDVDDASGVAALDRRAIVSQIETALRGSNIHVYRYSGNRPANPPGTPGAEGQLKVEVVAVRGTTGAEPQAVLRYDLAVAQWVRLEADETATALARTWNQGGVVAAPSSKSSALLRQALGDALDQLCRDYASARAYWLARQRAQAAEEAPNR